MKQPIMKWDAEKRTAYYGLFDADGNLHEGYAYCHEDDLDMMNEKTGLEIARRRAEIKGYKAYKYKLKNKLQALNQLYYSMKHSKKFNPKSYENIMLQRQIQMIKIDIDAANNIINESLILLKLYIAEKEAFYKQLRKLRERNNKQKGVE